MKDTEILQIQKLYENFKKELPSKTNLLYLSKSIYYLDWYNIKEYYSWYYIWYNWVDLVLFTKNDYIKFYLRDYWKEWCFTRKNIELIQKNKIKNNLF